MDEIEIIIKNIRIAAFNLARHYFVVSKKERTELMEKDIRDIEIELEFIKAWLDLD